MFNYKEVSMNRQLLFLFFCLIACISCDKEEDNWIEKDLQKNLVTYEVKCNTSGVPVRLYNMSHVPSELTIKDYWRGEYRTMAYYASILAECDDPDAMIEVKIFVNGTLKGHRYGNRIVEFGVKVK